jgi:hypothetical protein
MGESLFIYRLNPAQDQHSSGLSWPAGIVKQPLSTGSVDIFLLHRCGVKSLPDRASRSRGGAAPSDRGLATQAWEVGQGEEDQGWGELTPVRKRVEKKAMRQVWERGKEIPYSQQAQRDLR